MTGVRRAWVVGTRVVVRRRLPDGMLSDVVGDVLAADDDTLTVRARRGDVVIDLRDVVAAKPVPPRPVRRGAAHRALSVEGLEDVMADGWRPVELEHLGDWRLRASAGFTSRGNSALPLGSPGMTLPDAVEAVERFYGSRGLTPIIVVPHKLSGPGSLPGLGSLSGPGEHALDALLARCGWAVHTPTLVMTASVREVLSTHRLTTTAAGTTVAPGLLDADGLSVGMDQEPDAAWLDLYRYRGQPSPPVARQLLLSAPTQAFASVRRGGETVAVGRVAASRGWAGVTAMQVADSHRRQGLGRLVLGALAAWALEHRALSLYLQVSHENDGARALYASCGFTDHHGYQYRLAPS